MAETREISPEQQITNVLNNLGKLANGGHHRYRMDAIRSTISQLQDMWKKYQRGELVTLVVREGDPPF